MATQTGPFLFTGRLNNVIGYERNGVHFLRSMPARVKQTTATRQAARNFGIASRKGSLIRKAFAPHLDLRCDGAFVNRLNKVLIQSGVQGIKGYRFNRHTGLEKFFSHSPIFTPDGILLIPAQELSRLSGFTHFEIKAIAVRAHFTHRRTTPAVSITKRIDLSKPFEGMELNMTVPGKGTGIVVLQVRAFQGSLVMDNSKYMAAEVIAVTIAASPIPQTGKKHSKPRSKRWPLYHDLLLLKGSAIGYSSLALQQE